MSIQEKNPKVKRKVGLLVAKKKRRSIPDGATFTTTTLNKMSKRTRAGKKSPGYLLKREFKEWLRDYPGMSAAFWNVACVIVDLYNFRYGKAWPSTETIREMSGVKTTRTVDRAIKFFREDGIIFIKSGGYGSIRSNNYVPNLRLILNAETGGIIRNAPYMTKTENWAVVGVNFSASARGCHVPVRKNVVPKSGPQKCRTEKSRNRQKYATPVRKNVGLRSDSVVDGAKSAPTIASVDSAATVSAPRPNEESDQRKIGYIPIATLSLYLDMTFDGLIQLFAGKGSNQDIKNLDDFCKREIFNSGILKQDSLRAGTKCGHVIIHGDQQKVDFVDSGIGYHRLADLKSNSWLVIDYRVSPSYQTEAAAKVAALKVGI